MLVILRIKN